MTTKYESRIIAIEKSINRLIELLQNAATTDDGNAYNIAVEESIEQAKKDLTSLEWRSYQLESQRDIIKAQNE